MTDLTKGIIDINGFEISAKTTPKEVLNNLANTWVFKIVSEDGSDAFFRFENIKVLGRTFKIKVTFLHGELKSVRLDYTEHAGLPFKTLFTMDCEWLREILGNPTEIGSNGVVYKFDSVQIGVTNFESDGRCGADEFVQISY